jgi:tRNA nucleotidyltransferase/poly(A) polymerase
VLRLPRLLLQLPGFTTEPNTVALARESAPRLVDIAAERIRDELWNLFGYSEAHRGLAVLMELDLYPGLWLGRPGEPGLPGTALAELEALPGCLRELRKQEAALPDVDLRSARFAALFGSLPHPGDALRDFRDAGYLTRQAAADAGLLLDSGPLPEDEVARRRFLYKVGLLWPAAVCCQGARAAAHGHLAAWRRSLPPLLDLLRREGETVLNPPRLLTGEEVQALLGIQEGPAVGRALAAVRQAQVDGTVRTREEAEGLVRGMR